VAEIVGPLSVLEFPKRYSGARRYSFTSLIYVSNSGPGGFSEMNCSALALNTLADSLLPLIRQPSRQLT